MKKSIPYCPLTSKSSNVFFLDLFWTVFAWSIYFSLCIFLIQTKLFHWRKQYYGHNVTNILIMHLKFSLHQMLIDGLEWCGLLVDYCDVFISCLDSHSDGTHSLQRIHWWASDVMLHFSKSVLMKKQTHLHLEWPEGECIFSKFPFLGELFL